MPDVDVVERKLKGRWRAVYRMWKGGHPLNIVVDEMVKAAAAQLREEGGIPALVEANVALMDAASRQDASHSLAEKMRELERRFGYSGAVRGTVASVNRLLPQIEAGRSLPGVEPLAEERCRELIERCFFGRLQAFVGPGLPFAEFASLDRFREACLSSLDSGIRRLARRLVADPSASRLRAPAGGHRKRVTRELLDKPL